MKLTICFIFVLVLLGSCKSNRSAYEYRSFSPVLDRKPVSKIEKAWIARHQFDHERRLLIPKLGGARWGAVQEYKEDGTIEFRDWWERDVKIEDLEAVPSTLLSAPSNKKIKAIMPQIGFDRQVLPSEETTPAGVPEPFPVNAFHRMERLGAKVQNRHCFGTGIKGPGNHSLLLAQEVKTQPSMGISDLSLKACFHFLFADNHGTHQTYSHAGQRVEVQRKTHVLHFFLVKDEHPFILCEW